VPGGAAARCTGKAGAPAFAIPAGLDASGAPFGVTLITSRGGDRRLLDIGTTIAGIIGDSHAPAI
jgi:amidase